MAENGKAGHVGQKWQLGGWTRLGPTPPDLSSHSSLERERESLVDAFFFGKYHPIASSPAPKFHSGLRFRFMYTVCSSP